MTVPKSLHTHIKKTMTIMMVDRLFDMFFELDSALRRNELLLLNIIHLLILFHLIDSSSCLTSDVENESYVVRIDAVVAKI